MMTALQLKITKSVSLIVQGLKKDGLVRDQLVKYQLAIQYVETTKSYLLKNFVMTEDSQILIDVILYVREMFWDGLVQEETQLTLQHVIQFAEMVFD